MNGNTHESPFELPPVVFMGVETHWYQTFNCLITFGQLSVNVSVLALRLHVFVD